VGVVVGAPNTEEPDVLDFPNAEKPPVVAGAGLGDDTEPALRLNALLPNTLAGDDVEVGVETFPKGLAAGVGPEGDLNEKLDLFPSPVELGAENIDPVAVVVGLGGTGPPWRNFWTSLSVEPGIYFINSFRNISSSLPLKSSIVLATCPTRAGL